MCMSPCLSTISGHILSARTKEAVTVHKTPQSRTSLPLTLTRLRNENRVKVNGRCAALNPAWFCGPNKSKTIQYTVRGPRSGSPESILISVSPFGLQNQAGFQAAQSYHWPWPASSARLASSRIQYQLNTNLKPAWYQFHTYLSSFK